MKARMGATLTMITFAGCNWERIESQHVVGLRRDAGQRAATGKELKAEKIKKLTPLHEEILEILALQLGKN